MYFLFSVWMIWRSSSKWAFRVWQELWKRVITRVLLVWWPGFFLSRTSGQQLTQCLNHWCKLLNFWKHTSKRYLIQYMSNYRWNIFCWWCWLPLDYAYIPYYSKIVYIMRNGQQDFIRNLGLREKLHHEVLHNVSEGIPPGKFMTFWFLCIVFSVVVMFRSLAK